MLVHERDEVAAIEADQHGGRQRDHRHDPAPVDREEPRLAKRHARAVNEVGDLVAVGVHDRVLDLALVHDQDLVGRITDLPQVLAAHQPTRRRGCRERRQVGAIEILEQVGPRQPGEDINSLLHSDIVLNNRDLAYRLLLPARTETAEFGRPSWWRSRPPHAARIMTASRCSRSTRSVPYRRPTGEL